VKSIWLPCAFSIVTVALIGVCASARGYAAGNHTTGDEAGYDCPPRDEAGRRADLVAFRSSLQQAVARRDAAAVLKVTDPGIRTSFGTDDGLAFFERDLRDKRGQIWDDLADVLSGGGSFETPDSFRAPFWFGCADAEMREIIVVGTGVRARARPSAGARVLAVVSYAVLKGQEPFPSNAWAEVQLKDGRRGFIAGKYIRGPIGYRAYFSKINGSWRLMTFIGGD
jgi:hypothetical protein